MHTATNLIVDFQLTQCTETTSSVAMEKHGLEKVLQRTEESFQAGTLVTDRSPSIKKAMRTHKNIEHQFDIWHYAKSIAGKIRGSCKRKDWMPLLEWLPAIIIHLWWCCRTCGGSAEMLLEKWDSILYHVTNRHTWTEGCLFLQCAHSPLTEEQQRRKKWLKPGSIVVVSCLVQAVCCLLVFAPIIDRLFSKKGPLFEGQQIIVVIL